MNKKSPIVKINVCTHGLSQHRLLICMYVSMYVSLFINRVQCLPVQCVHRIVHIYSDVTSVVYPPRKM